MASAVLAGSASSKTITGALPPSSRWTFLRSAAAAMATSRPARTLPVIDTICGTGLVTRARPVSRSPHTTLNTPGGQDVAHQLGQQQGGVGRGVGRLEHHGVARRQGRAELPHRHHHRVVPRRHRGAHPDRLAPDERGEAGHVLTRRAALQHPRRAREEPDLVHHRRDLFGQGQRERLARCSATRPSPARRRGTRWRPRSGAGPGSARPAWSRASPGTPRPPRRTPPSTSVSLETGAVAKTSPVLGSISSDRRSNAVSVH